MTDSLGRYLEAARVQAGHSLRHLARTTGLPLSSLYRIINDEVERPSAANLMQLARALDLNPAEVFARAGIEGPLTDLDTLLRTEYDLPDQAIADIHAIIAANTTPKGECP
ncbi:helix-turn-helix domain-containing protein [Nonomuraea sediminis]|uniref:helix-turn-helix domain-containing protein n=1 Tax=Nonomuraea sediminis TaxID=2835864 RepID=UPI001BDC3503|nr:helix-turn-helix transcriptional regulator [Nonomuraea sediminis]